MGGGILSEIAVESFAGRYSGFAVGGEEVVEGLDALVGLFGQG